MFPSPVTGREAARQDQEAEERGRQGGLSQGVLTPLISGVSSNATRIIKNGHEIGSTPGWKLRPAPFFCWLNAAMCDPT